MRSRARSACAGSTPIANARSGCCSRPTRNVVPARDAPDRKSTRLNSSHSQISYAVFCLKKKKRMRVVARIVVRDERVVQSLAVIIDQVPDPDVAAKEQHLHENLAWLPLEDRRVGVRPAV